MFCTKCGNNIADDARFCAKCGTPTNVGNQQPAPQQPVYQQPVYQQPAPQQPVYQQPVYQQPVYQQPVYQQPVSPITLQQKPPLPMKWFHFQIYFALFAGALLNLGQAILYFTGMIYGPDADLIYDVFSDLPTLDMCLGVCLLVVVFLQILARFRLAGYCKNGPSLLYAVYGTVILTNIVYAVCLYGMIPEEAQKYMDFTSSFTGIAMNCLMLSLNMTYFKKRAHLFVN